MLKYQAMTDETPTKKRAPRKQYPKHAVTHQVVEAALEVSDALFARLHATLDVCCELREALRLQREANRDEARRLTAAGSTPHYLTQNDQYRFHQRAGGPRPALRRRA